MAEKLKVELQDDEGNIYYLHTDASVVFCEDGQTVEAKMLQKIDQSAIIQNATTAATNKVVSAAVAKNLQDQITSQNTKIIIDHGENYIKYANGLMECWGECTTYGQTGVAVVTFPAAFADLTYVPFVCSEYYGSNYPAFLCSVQRASANTMNVYTRQAGGGILGGVTCEWRAVGRWK